MAKVTLKAITPKRFQTKQIRQAVESEMSKVGEELLGDFEATTSGWKTDVKFSVESGLGGGSASITVSTSDAVYNWVSNGTKPHMIYPRRARVLRYPHPSGGIWYSRYEHHPGIKARNFAQKIAARYRGRLASRIQAAIGRAAGG